MKEVTIKDIVKICSGRLVCGQEDIVCHHFSKDTRQIEEGDIYVGIKGGNFDGSKFWKRRFSESKICG